MKEYETTVFNGLLSLYHSTSIDDYSTIMKKTLLIQKRIDSFHGP